MLFNRSIVPTSKRLAQLARVGFYELLCATIIRFHGYVEGDDKARGKLTGFFMGKVMQASKGQADGKAATALLRSRAGV